MSQEFYALLEQVKLGNMSERTVLTVKAEDRVVDLFQILSSNNMHGVVVVEPTTNNPIGFIDGLDIMTEILFATNAYTQDPTKEEIDALMAQGNTFFQKSCRDLINRSGRDPLVSLNVHHSLLDAMKILRESHRIIIKNDEDKMVNVFSQMDVISFLLSRYELIQRYFKRPLLEGGFVPMDVVGSLKETTSVIGALRYMRDCAISGIAVLNDKEQIISNFSATDLLKLTPKKFFLLIVSLREYLTQVYGQLKPPVCCQITDTVETLMLKFERFNVHRIYVVDDDLKPTGFYSLTDVIGFLLVNAPK